MKVKIFIVIILLFLLSLCCCTTTSAFTFDLGTQGTVTLTNNKTNAYWHLMSLAGKSGDTVADISKAENDAFVKQIEGHTSDYWTGMSRNKINGTYWDESIVRKY